MDTEDWKKILDAAHTKLAQLKNLPRTSQRDKVIQRLAETAGHFSLINDAWRKFSAHGRSQHNEASAKVIMNHVEAFMKLLAGPAIDTKIKRSAIVQALAETRNPLRQEDAKEKMLKAPAKDA